MTRSRAALVGAAMLCLAGSPLAGQTRPARVEADPRLELLAIVFRLGGASEFSQILYALYDSAIVRHFEPFRDHEAVHLARGLREKRGVQFSTVMSLAIALEPLPGLEPRRAYDSLLGSRVPGEEMRRFVEALRRFTADTRAIEFFAAHRILYDSAAARIRRPLEQLGAFRWAETFFGVADRDFVVSPLLANSGGNYGPCVLPTRGTGAGRLECWQILGHQSTDSAGFAVFPNQFVELITHEMSHSYMNPLGDMHRGALERSASRVHAAFAETMRAQAYTSWSTMVNESLVRAAVARSFEALGSPEERWTYLADQRGVGWLWLDEVSALFAEYENNRRNYPTVAEFMPRVIAYYDSLPDRIPAMKARYEAGRPRVASISLPSAEGATVVRGLEEIVVRFDRPVRDGPWSLVPLFVEGRPTSTELPPRPVTGHTLDAGGTTLRIAVELEPGRDYAFQLNTPNGFGFRTEDGIPLLAYPIRFRTR